MIFSPENSIFDGLFQTFLLNYRIKTVEEGKNKISNCICVIIYDFKLELRWKMLKIMTICLIFFTKIIFFVQVPKI